MEGAKQSEIYREKHNEFNYWRAAFTESNPEIRLPNEGTPSDIFKAVLRHFLSEYGERLKVETVATIELQYLMRPNLEPEDFLAAEKLIEKNLEK